MKIIIESDTMIHTEATKLNNIKPLYYKRKEFVPYKIIGTKPNILYYDSSIYCIYNKTRKSLLIPLGDKLNISFRNDCYIAFIES